MEEQNFVTFPFPYDFNKISDEEKDLIKQVYNSPNATKMVRVGPKGYILYESYRKNAPKIYNMPLRTSDVFVASFQRSETTWIQELVWLLANDLDYSAAAATPLTERYHFLELFMYFDEEDPNLNNTVEKDNVDVNKIETMKLWATPATQLLASAPSPRLVKTNLPMSLLPPKILKTAKVVYLARDPRHVVVSCYLHAKLFTATAYSGTFKEFWNLFHKNLFTLTPYFEHVKEAWDKRRDPNILFLFYEELSKDLSKAIWRIAEFMGKQLTKEQMDGLCNHLSIENFKNNKSVNYEDLREFDTLADNENFFKKGKAGSWRHYFDKEMTQQADQWIMGNLGNTDLRFPRTDIFKAW